MFNPQKSRIYIFCLKIQTFFQRTFLMCKFGRLRHCGVLIWHFPIPLTLIVKNNKKTKNVYKTTKPKASEDSDTGQSSIFIRRSLPPLKSSAKSCCSFLFDEVQICVIYSFVRQSIQFQILLFNFYAYHMRVYIVCGLCLCVTARALRSLSPQIFALSNSCLSTAAEQSWKHRSPPVRFLFLFLFFNCGGE